MSDILEQFQSNSIRAIQVVATLNLPNDDSRLLAKETLEYEFNRITKKRDAEVKRLRDAIKLYLDKPSNREVITNLYRALEGK